jgi:hypothetical protein
LIRDENRSGGPDSAPQIELARALAGNLDAAKNTANSLELTIFLAKAEQRSLLSPSVGSCDALHINVISVELLRLATVDNR